MTQYSPVMEAALHRLYWLIERGVEFPDACWKVANQHGFKVDKLRQAYDIREGERSEKR